MGSNTINEKSVDGVLGTRTRGGSLVHLKNSLENIFYIFNIGGALASFGGRKAEEEDHRL